jgi:hypothetical protein
VEEAVKDEEQPEVVDGTAVEEGLEELAEAVEPLLPEEMTVSDPSDTHTAMVVFDNHDVAMLMEKVQATALRKWIYDLPGVGKGLTVHAVQDITQLMNWSGKCRIGVLPETLSVEQITADEGNGPEPFWVATIFARDESTGAMLPGSSMEPQRMRLKPATAKKKRDAGATIPEDNSVFDRFARTKAIQKATRNALASFIPEEIEQTVIALFEKDPRRVERIQTEAEAKAEEFPPPLDTPEAKALIAKCEKLYDEIRELRGGQGAVKFPPGLFASWMLRSQHDVGALQRFVDYLEDRKTAIPVELVRESQELEARDTATKVACPACEAAPNKFCKGIRGAHPERVKARLAAIQSAA